MVRSGEYRRNRSPGDVLSGHQLRDTQDAGDPELLLKVLHLIRNAIHEERRGGVEINLSQLSAGNRCWNALRKEISSVTL